MPSPLIFALAVGLGLYLIPAWLLRRQTLTRAQDRFVAPEPTPPGVIQNSSVAGALRVAAAVPLFAWGASGDFWPAIVAAVGFGLGVGLLAMLRRPMLAFLDDALAHDRSITVHEFIARQHGNDPRLRLLAAALTIIALLGLVLGEALALAALLGPVTPGVAVPLVCALLVLVMLVTMRSANSAAMRAAQTQLGMVYLGLLGATVLLLYVPISGLKPVPPPGILAIACVAAIGALLPFYRRSRYVDTTPVDSGSRLAGMFRRLLKILNPLITAVAVVVIVLAAMEFVTVGLPAVARDSVTALQVGTRAPAIGLIALLLLPLLYPVVDMTNWQRLAAFAKGASDVDPGRRHAGLGTLLRRYAVESSTLWLFICMIGAIAAVAAEMPGNAATLPALLARLTAQPDTVAAMALSLLLIGVLAIALSAIGAMVSASLCTLHYDILPAVRPQLEPAAAARRGTIAGAGLILAVALAFYAAASCLRIDFTGGALPALLVASCCAQLALAPLILGPLIGRRRGGVASVSGGWALAVLGCAAAAGAGAVTVYLVTGAEFWLWAAVPACLGTGAVLFAVARAAAGRTPP